MKKSLSHIASPGVLSNIAPASVRLATAARRQTLGVALALEAMYLMLVGLTLRGASSVWFLKCYICVGVGAGVLWGGLLWRWRPAQLPLSYILGFALLFRLTLMVVPPMTSTDVFRYVWDGKVFVQTGNPYRFAPQSESLAPLRDERIFPRINHPELPTIYPPLAQVLFAVAYLIGGDSLIGIKLLNLFAEMLTLWLLWRLWLVSQSFELSWIVAYAWCPLPILESMGAAHVDTLGLPLLVLFYSALDARRSLAGGLALAGAALVKLFPVVLLPLLWRRVTWSARLMSLAACLIPLTLGWAMFFFDADDPLRSLKVYAWNWQFNAPLFAGFQFWLGDGYRARQLCLALFALVAGAIMFAEVRPIPAAQWLWLAFFLCGTTVFPWYLVWMVPGLIMGFSFPVVWLIVTAPLTYVTELEYQVSGVWRESLLVWAVEFLPVAGWLLWKLAVSVWIWRNEKRSLESSGRPAHFLKAFR